MKNPVTGPADADCSGQWSLGLVPAIFTITNFKENIMTDVTNHNDLDFNGTGDIEFAVDWLDELLWEIADGDCDSGETYIKLRGQQFKILITPTEI